MLKNYRFMLVILVCFMVLTLQGTQISSAFNLGQLTGRPAKVDVPQTSSFEVAFSPSREAEETILRFIGEAQRSVHVAAYSFTSREVAGALVKASRRGLDVRVVADKSNLGERYTAATYLANQKIPVRINSVYAIQHQKVVIVDGVSVQTGSYNYSSAARDRNSENVLVIRNVPELAARYEANWQRLWGESQPMSANY